MTRQVLKPLNQPHLECSSDFSSVWSIFPSAFDASVCVRAYNNRKYNHLLAICTVQITPVIITICIDKAKAAK